MVLLSKLAVAVGFAITVTVQGVGKPGELCDLSFPCNDDLFCSINGRCTPKLVTGNWCVVDYQCHSGLCENFVCACTSNDQCQLQVKKKGQKKRSMCDEYGTCQILRKKKDVEDLYLDNGALCKFAPIDDLNDITEHPCKSNKCSESPRLPWAPRNENFQALGMCQCSELHPCEGGTPCMLDEECLYGKCLPDIHNIFGSTIKTCGCEKHKHCSKGYKCKNKVCTPLGLAEEKCKKNKHCLSGECKNKKCTCDYVTNAGCKYDQLCSYDGSECLDKFLGGEMCYSNMECLSGLCFDGYCACGTSSNPASVDCIDGEFCDTRTANQFPDIHSDGEGIECKPAYEGGLKCSDDTMCLSGECIISGSNTYGRCGCRNSVINGDVDCATPDTKCVNDRCVALRKEGETCNPNNDICLAECDGGTCTCQVDEHCDNANHYCDAGECKARLGVDESCSFCDGNGICECASGICNADGKCGCLSSGTSKQKCPSGTFCGADDECSAKKSGNAPCQDNDECVSGTCSDDICVCGLDSDCESGYKCATGGTCKLKNGQTCPQPGPDEDCDSSYCTTDNTCGKGLGGDLCAENSNCQGNCENGECTCKKNNNDAVDCADSEKYCDDASDLCIPKDLGGVAGDADSCLTGETYDINTVDYCTCDYANGIECADQTVGVSPAPVVVFERFCVGHGQNLGYCARKRIGGLSCPSLYEEAYKNSFCLSGKCGDDYKCTCSSTIPCGDSEYCDGETCMAKKAAIEECSGNDECKSGSCVQGKCGCDPQAQFYCSGNYYCKSGECIDKLKGGATCNGDFQCSSNDCDGGKCACSDVVACEDQGFFCNSSYECEAKLSIETECTSDTECDSNKCEVCQSVYLCQQGQQASKVCVCDDNDDCPGAQSCVAENSNYQDVGLCKIVVG